MKQSLIKNALLALAVIAPSMVFAAPEPEREVPPRLDLPGAIQFALENNFEIRQAR